MRRAAQGGWRRGWAEGAPGPPSFSAQGAALGAASCLEAQVFVAASSRRLCSTRGAWRGLAILAPAGPPTPPLAVLPNHDRLPAPLALDARCPCRLERWASDRLAVKAPATERRNKQRGGGMWRAQLLAACLLAVVAASGRASGQQTGGSSGGSGSGAASNGAPVSAAAAPAPEPAAAAAASPAAATDAGGGGSPGLPGGASTGGVGPPGVSWLQVPGSTGRRDLDGEWVGGLACMAGGLGLGTWDDRMPGARPLPPRAAAALPCDLLSFPTPSPTLPLPPWRRSPEPAAAEGLS